MSAADGRSRRHRRGVVLGWVGAVCLVLAPATLPVAGAQFTASTSDTGNAVAAADVAAPTGFAAVQSCSFDTIAQRGTPSSNVSNTGSLTLSTPAGTQAGDILVAHVTNRYDNSYAMNFSSGLGSWTAIGIRETQGNGASAVSGAVYWRLATSTEPATHTFSLTGGAGLDMAGGLVAYSGVNPTAPILAFGQTKNTSTTATTPPINVTVSNARLIHAFTKRAEATPPPTGTNQLWRVLSPTGTTNQGSTVVDEVVTVTGMTGARTSTGGATDWIAHTFALRPATVVSASLSWTASTTSGASGYLVERYVGGTRTRFWDVTPISSTGTTDGSLTNGTTYSYRVTAYGGTWNSATVSAAPLTPSCP